MRYFPIFLDLNQKPVLVVGGGDVACRKVDMLLRAGALVTIVSPHLHPQLQQAVERGELAWEKRFYQSDLLTGFVQVWATTDNPDLNHEVHADAKAANILVNVVDDTPYCDFITPSVINRGRIQIAISSGGGAPVLIRKIREKFETQLAQNLSLVADFATSKRDDIKQHLPNVDLRRKFWERYFEHPDVESATSREQLESLYQDALKRELNDEGQLTWLEFGQDPEMLSLKAMRLMQQAELVLYPPECPFSFIDLVRRDADRQTYGSTDELNQLITQNQALRICVFIDKSQLDPKLNLMMDQKHKIPILG
ncbi:MAG: siroheme synthase [Vibrio sp.]